RAAVVAQRAQLRVERGGGGAGLVGGLAEGRVAVVVAANQVAAEAGKVRTVGVDEVGAIARHLVLGNQRILHVDDPTLGHGHAAAGEGLIGVDGVVQERQRAGKVASATKIHAAAAVAAAVIQGAVAGDRGGGDRRGVGPDAAGFDLETAA